MPRKKKRKRSKKPVELSSNHVLYKNLVNTIENHIDNLKNNSDSISFILSTIQNISKKGSIEPELLKELDKIMKIENKLDKIFTDIEGA